MRRVLLSAVFALAACKTPTDKPAAPAQAAGRGATAIDPGQQIASIDGQPLTYADLEKEQKDLATKVKQREVQFLNEVYELRKDALDNLIAKRLLEGEAKKAGKPLEKWMQEDFQSGISKPSADEVKKFFEEHKGDLPPDTKIEDVTERIEKVLQSQQGRDKFQKLVGDLKERHKVTVALAAPELPRVEVAPVGPVKGPADAKVTIVEFSDFQCPFCSREVPVIERVLKDYAGKVRVIFRHFPLDFHEQAQKAAEASLCAHEQGKFWEMHDKLFASQGALEPPKLKEYAKGLQLDAAKFDKCLDGGEKKAAVEADMKAAGEAGVSGTPAFFVNGILISGAQEFDKFKEVIDRELARK